MYDWCHSKDALFNVQDGHGIVKNIDLNQMRQNLFVFVQSLNRYMVVSITFMTMITLLHANFFFYKNSISINRMFLNKVLILYTQHFSRFLVSFNQLFCFPMQKKYPSYIFILTTLVLNYSFNKSQHPTAIIILNNLAIRNEVIKLTQMH